MALKGNRRSPASPNEKLQTLPLFHSEDRGQISETPQLNRILYLSSRRSIIPAELICFSFPHLGSRFFPACNLSARCPMKISTFLEVFRPPFPSYRYVKRIPTKNYYRVVISKRHLRISVWLSLYGKAGYCKLLSKGNDVTQICFTYRGQVIVLIIVSILFCINNTINH
jgi:hypothetical protein